MSPCYRQARTSIGAATPIRRVRARPIWRALAASQGTASSGVRRSPALAKGRNAGCGGRQRVPHTERTPHHLTPSRPRPAHHGIEPARCPVSPDVRFRPMSGFDGAEPIGSFFSQHADLIEFPLYPWPWRCKQTESPEPTIRFRRESLDHPIGKTDNPRINQAICDQFSREVDRADPQTDQPIVSCESQ